jgi:hypothetical protein
VRRAELLSRKPRHDELRPFQPDSVRKAPLPAPSSNNGLRKSANSANHVKPSAELQNGNVEVIDDLAANIPITNRELDVIETYLGSLLDGMLGEK